MNFPKIKFSNMLIGNVESGLAICTFWTNIDKYKEYSSVCAIIGNLYTKEGIKYFLYNIAYSRIKYIIFCGNDRNSIIPVLCKLKEYPPKKTESIFNEIYFLYCKSIAELTGLINSYQNMMGKNIQEGALDQQKPVVSSNNNVVASNFSYINTNPVVAWHWILNKILIYGCEVDSTKEIMNVSITVANRNIKNLDIPYYMDNYKDTLLDDNKYNDLDYTYGNRLFEHFGVDQVDKCINVLSKKRDTRQAHITLWDPKVDYNNHPPCLISLSFYIRDNKLFVTAVFRSHDILKAWLNNYSSICVLQNYIIDELQFDVTSGSITMCSQSAHIYNYDVVNTRNIISSTSDKQYFSFDKCSVYFTRCEDKYTANILSSKGTIDIIAANSKLQLKNKLLPYICNVGHAVYIADKINEL